MEEGGLLPHLGYLTSKTSTRTYNIYKEYIIILILYRIVIKLITIKVCVKWPPHYKFQGVSTLSRKNLKK